MRKALFFIAVLTSFICHGQINLNQGLIAFYPFNGSADDASGNNLNGVVSNAALTSDRFGMYTSAYYFNGVNSFIQLPYSPLYNFAPQDSFSISVRVLPDQGNTWPAQAIVVKSPFHPDFNQSLWNYGVYLLNYKAMSGYAYNPVVNGTTLFTGDPCWYNIVVTYKNGVWKLYVNGILESSDPSQSKFILQDGPASRITLGRKGDASGDYYKGKMDDVRIYNRVLNTLEIAALSECSPIAGCNNWLYTPSATSSVRIGDLDITGNQLTIEANVLRTAYSTQYLTSSIDIVGKQSGIGDNVQSYYFGTELAVIKTTDGFFDLLIPCPTLLNKVYHLAMVYDGSKFRYYRDGVLIKEVNATGNLSQTDRITSIGLNEFSSNPAVLSNFVGYINEVRFWKVARSQAELQAYMLSPLPNPATQPGLVAYYTFDNLLNKQGNPAYDGTLNGAASINQTSPYCAFTQNTGGFALAGDDTTFCSTTTVSYVLKGNGYGTYSWTPAALLNNPTILNPTATINSTTTFYLTVTGPNSCTATDSVTIFVSPPASIKTLSDTSVCNHFPLVLTATPGLSVYNWSPGTLVTDSTIANPVFTGTVSTAMIITGSNSMGCSAKDTVNITIKNLPLVKTIEDTILCNTNSVTLFTTGAQSYSWDPVIFLNNPNAANPVYTGNLSQTYIVTGTGSNGCEASDTVNVLIGVKPVISISKSNDIDCAFHSATLLATGGTNYLWSPSTGLSNVTVPNPVATPVISQTYTVLVTTANGCSNSDTITVFFNRSGSLARYVPNAFTPNNDGLNDCFGIKSWMHVRNVEFLIFNRYGEQVFATSDPLRCWDGNYKGKKSEPGSYLYYIKAETDCGPEEQRGSFLLIR